MWHIPDWRDVLKGSKASQDSSDSTNKTAKSKRVAERRGHPPVHTCPDYRDAHNNDRSSDRSDTDEELQDSIAAMESEGDELERATGGHNPEPVSPVIERDSTETDEHASTGCVDAMNLLSRLTAKNNAANIRFQGG